MHLKSQAEGIKNQSERSHKLIESLCSTLDYPHEVSTIKVVETHISWVLLTGPFAYKIKKPVNFGFLDFSTLEKRYYFCQEELRLNRRLAKNLYLDVIPITGEADKPLLGGNGNVLEYAVKMMQFPEKMTLSEIAKNGKLGYQEIDQIADLLARFHESIACADTGSNFGNPETNKTWFEENFDHIEPRIHSESQLRQLQAIKDWGQKEWNRRKEFMQQRKEKGYVRECHGDVHLGNMTMIDGQVTLFDCIEFNPMLRWIDVMSETAFLIIHLLHSGYAELGYRFLNRYLSNTGDYQGIILLRYYLVYRALVLAKVSLLRFEQQHGEISGEIAPDYLQYISLAERFTLCEPLLLVITHGFSGSGKSFYSSKLADMIGAVHIRSDIERKRQFGFAASARTGCGIESGLYSAESSQKTYTRLRDLAGDVIMGGFSVIVDAAFLKTKQRDLFHALAELNHVHFLIIAFQASDSVLQHRILQRQKENFDPSEGTLAVLKHQQQSIQPLANSEFTHTISIDTERGDALKTLVEGLTAIQKSDVV